MYSTSPSSSSQASSSGRSSPEHTSPQQPQRSNSFLPQFLFSSSSNTNTTSQDNASQPVTNALLTQAPRRTSFGAALSSGGRFSALSAFGFTGLSSSPPASAVTSPVSEASSLQNSHSNASTSTTAPATTAPPPKRHLCFPDGMGGTMCLEIKDRSRRGSSVN